MHNDFKLLGREDDQRRLLDILSDRSMLLMGPRRVGKTELLTALARSHHPRWRFTLVDVQGLDTQGQFVEAVRRALGTADLLRPLSPVIDRVDSVEVGGLVVRTGEASDPWDALATMFTDAIDRLEEGETLVLAMDEVPWWIDALEKADPGAARTTLARLRGLRQPTSLGARLRMVFTGSIGLIGLASELGASAEINDLLPVFELHPLEAVYGEALFEEELTRYGRPRSTEESRKLAQRVTGGFPHWLKVLAQKAAARGEGEISGLEVTAAVDDLLGPRNRAVFNDEGIEHFARRYGRQQARAAWAVLDLTAGEAAGASHEALVGAALASGLGTRREAEEILYRLADSWYIEQTEAPGWRFMLPLFRLWWARYGGGAG